MKKKTLIRQVIPSVIFIAVMITIKFLEGYFQLHWAKYGVFPRSLEGFLGIITSPFVHGDWKHVINNLSLIHI